MSRSLRGRDGGLLSRTPAGGRRAVVSPKLKVGRLHGRDIKDFPSYSTLDHPVDLVMGVTPLIHRAPYVAPGPGGSRRG